MHCVLCTGELRLWHRRVLPQRCCGTGCALRIAYGVRFLRTRTLRAQLDGTCGPASKIGRRSVMGTELAHDTASPLF